MESYFEEMVDLQAHLSRGVRIHPTAVVAKGAELGEQVVIGPHAVIGPKVKLYDQVVVGPGALIEGRTTIGQSTRVYAHATVGTSPQDLKYDGEDTCLEVGAHNAIREYVNISIGTEGGGGVTRIGDHNLFMTYTHIAHDCKIANHCIFANGVQIAGHVEIGNNVVFGGMSGGHQFCRFGTFAMVGAGAIVVQDVAPYCMVQGDRATLAGLNRVGLRRSHLSREDIKVIKEIYNTVFKSNLCLEDALAKVKSEYTDSEPKTCFVDFLENSHRGLCR